MSSNVVNQMPYIRSSRQFPQDPQALQVELDKSYIDIASAVNLRVIGIHATVRPSITGEQWFIANNRMQQTLRQVYSFTATTAINHNIPNVIPGQFLHCYGSYSDSTNTFGLIFGTSVAIAGQISFYVTSTQIIFVVGAGAPALTSGVIVLHWVSRP